MGALIPHREENKGQKNSHYQIDSNLMSGGFGQVIGAKTQCVLCLEENGLAKGGQARSRSCFHSVDSIYQVVFALTSYEAGPKECPLYL